MSLARSSFVVLLLVLASNLRAQPVISYLYPDIGAAGMNTYIDLIAPYNVPNSFGSDGLYLNNRGDVVRVECANAPDTNKIKIGPVIVSWNGRSIATQIFVMPNVQPNSADWRQLQPAFRIPIRIVLNGNASNTDTFFLVQPNPFQGASNTSTTPVVLGEFPQLPRSKRGAFLFDSLKLTGNGRFTISTADCDAQTPGNQGYLPAVILAKHSLTIDSGVILDVSGDSIFGGPGGGGGSHGDGPVTTVGGDGFTGGSSGETYCPTKGGTGSGGIASGTTGGAALNGLPGGSAGETEGVGGSGNPFVATGGGINESNHHEGDGNGGSFGTQGQNGVGQRGSSDEKAGPVNGNDMLVPLMGGSGGGGGNEVCSCAKTTPGAFGGGGGGALRVYAPTLNIYGAKFKATGAVGFAGEIGCVQHQSVGGCGSGGSVELNGKLPFRGQNIRVDGGTSLHNHSGNGFGGSGRLRLNGPSGTTSSSQLATHYYGPSTDTSTWVNSSFTLSGTAGTKLINSNLIIFLKSETGSWQAMDTLHISLSARWSAPITLAGADSLYFLAVALINDNQSTAPNTMEPAFIMSQAGANILHSTPLSTTCSCLPNGSNKGLVAYWPFCNGSLNDESGHSHTGSPFNTPTSINGIFDQAYQFNGSNGINVPFSPEFDIPTDSALTLAAWVKPLSITPGAYQALVVKGSAGNWDYGLYIDIDQPRFMFGCSWPNHEVFSKTTIQPGTWYHVCGVYCNSSWKIFVNGQPEEYLTNGTPLQRSSNGFGFGKKGNGVADMYTGALDEIRLYNRALSDSEVLALYHASSTAGNSYQHLEIRSGSLGNVITLPMSADFADSAMLRTSWPNLSSISSTITFDPTRLSFISINPPTGWSISALNSTANSRSVTITNQSGLYTRPLALGDALFKITGPTPGMTLVTLDRLSFNVAGVDNDVCLGKSEDALWGIVVKPQSEVSSDEPNNSIQVRPNPFNERLLVIGGKSEITSVQLFDVLGHTISVELSASGEIDTEGLPAGAYLLVCHTRSGTQTVRLNKLR